MADADPTATIATSVLPGAGV